MSALLDYKIKEFEALCAMISYDDLVIWADDKIRFSDDPDEILFELSLAKTLHEQLSILSSLGEQDENEAFKQVAYQIFISYKQDEIQFFDVVNKLHAMNINSTALDSSYRDFCIWISDEAWLISDGVKDLKPAEEELIRFFFGVKT
ncbi:hypothetical protein C9J12_29580 [Photobacterium frigidiphilum]|uniref:Uncharacterized protein n=1 Tax=Photobacterium frigidiphilum TaxID=264736 RepID=A0A2T3J5R9_9GAMM|nr:hypothetical protein [Photobacterium frigidiphilum]PSU41563.1 hypothetical protein C9J12_29580 [Photobacterium frigidiphilum]